jgi:hypothetical protein
MATDITASACTALAELLGVRPTTLINSPTPPRHTPVLDAQWPKPNTSGFYLVKVIDWNDYPPGEVREKARRAAEDACVAAAYLEHRLGDSTFCLVCVAGDHVDTASLATDWTASFTARRPSDSSLFVTTHGRLLTWHPGDSDGTFDLRALPPGKTWRATH